MDFGARFCVKVYAPDPSYVRGGRGEAGVVDVDGALEVGANEIRVAAVGLVKVRSLEICGLDVLLVGMRRETVTGAQVRGK